MQVSTKARYALRILIHMTAHASDGNVKIKDVSEHENISVKYLEQVISVLSKAGMVSGSRGPQGGYRLNVDPTRVTAGDVVRLVDGPTAPAPCTGPDGIPCANSGRCASEEMWTRIGAAADEIMDEYTLADLAGRLVALAPESGSDYCI